MSSKGIPEGRSMSMSKLQWNCRSSSFLIRLKIGCWMAWSIVILLRGSNTKDFSRKSYHSGRQYSKIQLALFLVYLGWELRQERATSSSTKVIYSGEGVPKNCRILDLCLVHNYIWSSSEWGYPPTILQLQSLVSLGGERGKQPLPSKSALLGRVILIFLLSLCSAMSSPMMHPTDQIQMEESYLVCISMIQGARYHRLTTWRVIFCKAPVWLFFRSVKVSSGRPDLASPKSHNLILKSLSERMFSGLRSRCRIFTVERYLSTTSN